MRSAQLRPVKIDLAPQSRANCGQRVDSGRRTALQVSESAHALVHFVCLCVYSPHTAWWRKDRTITLGRRLGRGLLGASSTRSIHTRISTRTSSKHVNPAVSWRPGRNLDPAKTPPQHAPPDRSGRARSQDRLTQSQLSGERLAPVPDHYFAKQLRPAGLATEASPHDLLDSWRQLAAAGVAWIADERAMRTAEWDSMRRIPRGSAREGHVLPDLGLDERCGAAIAKVAAQSSASQMLCTTAGGRRPNRSELLQERDGAEK